VGPAEASPHASGHGKAHGHVDHRQHYALDPGWLDPLEHITSGTRQHYDYLVHDALIKPMPQGVQTYSLAEQAEMTADFTKAAFRLRAGLKFQDDRTIIFHFKEPFVDLLDLYNGGNTGIGWVVRKHYYEQVGRDGFKAHPLGAGPFTFVSQEAGVQMVFEAWEEYWRRSAFSSSRASGRPRPSSSIMIAMASWTCSSAIT
jgi:peptide/nickel transport system substrate-binding protein